MIRHPPRSTLFPYTPLSRSREAAGATDARDHHEILPANAKLRKDGLHRREDGVIAAAGTPAHFLVGLKVFFREWRKRRGGHRWFPGIPSISSNFCSSSARSEEHTSELQSRLHLVCRLLLEKKKEK